MSSVRSVSVMPPATNHVVAAGEAMTPDRLFEQIRRDLDDLRALLAGPSPPPVTVGLSGLALPPRARVDLGDLGVLHAAARREALSQ
jgi:hypothetical protein